MDADGRRCQEVVAIETTRLRVIDRAPVGTMLSLVPCCVYLRSFVVNLAGSVNLRSLI